MNHLDLLVAHRVIEVAAGSEDVVSAPSTRRAPLRRAVGAAFTAVGLRLVDIGRRLRAVEQELARECEGECSLATS